MTLTFFLSAMVFLHVSHCCPWLLTFSHCLSGPMELLHCLSLSPLVAGCLSHSLPVPCSSW